MGRYDRLRQIEKLDPKRDHVEIYHLMFGYEFPWDMTRAPELARRACLEENCRLTYFMSAGSFRYGRYEFHKQPEKTILVSRDAWTLQLPAQLSISVKCSKHFECD